MNPHLPRAPLADGPPAAAETAAQIRADAAQFVQRLLLTITSSRTPALTSAAIAMSLGVYLGRGVTWKDLASQHNTTEAAIKMHASRALLVLGVTENMRKALHRSRRAGKGSYVFRRSGDTKP